MMNYPELPCIPDIDKLVDRFILSLPCRDQKPYPPPDVTSRNPELGKDLLDAFADGAAAELTAIAQYMYHAFTEANPIGNLQFCIALVEMKHLELIGETVKNLGADPKYRRANQFYWTGGYVGYGVNTCDKLVIDRDAEIAAIDGYNRLLRLTNDPLVRRTITRILDDEHVHLHLFNQALATYCAPPPMP